MKNKLQKATPAWHAEAVAMLKENFDKIHGAFLDATKRAVWMGMFLNHIKSKGKEDGSIPHGQFEPWRAKNVPHLSSDTMVTYMRLATGVCEKGKFEITEFPSFADLGHLPPKIEKLIEGKTQQQLFFEFKQCEDGVNPKVGRRKGEGGASSGQRAAAKQVRIAAEIAGLKLQIGQFGELADLLANDLAIGNPEVGDEFAVVFPKVENLFRYMQRIQKGRAR